STALLRFVAADAMNLIRSERLQLGVCLRKAGWRAELITSLGKSHFILDANEKWTLSEAEFRAVSGLAKDRVRESPWSMSHCHSLVNSQRPTTQHLLRRGRRTIW